MRMKDIPNTACGKMFRKAMERRQYGHDALSNAWGWFTQGWEDSLEWSLHKRG